MSHETIAKANADPELRNRVLAAIAKETWANPTYGNSAWGKQVQQYGPNQLLDYFMWPISIDNEVPYEYAVDSGNEHPGNDKGVITDAALSTGVQVHWPPDSALMPPTPTSAPSAPAR